VKKLITTLRNIWSIEDLKSKIIVTLSLIFVYRLGTFIVLPGIDPNKLSALSGAKSGALRTSPLLYVPDGENLVMVASKGGFPKNPAWFHNLRANPVTYVQVDAERRRVRARVATAEERPHLWDLAVAVWPGYEDYRRRTDREIPLVVLEPA